jgi:hypothetical protein
MDAGLTARRPAYVDVRIGGMARMTRAVITGPSPNPIRVTSRMIRPRVGSDLPALPALMATKENLPVWPMYRPTGMAMAAPITRVMMV